MINHVLILLILPLPQDILLLIFNTGVVHLFSDFPKLFFKSYVPCHVWSLNFLFCYLSGHQSPIRDLPKCMKSKQKEKKKLSQSL